MTPLALDDVRTLLAWTIQQGEALILTELGFPELGEQLRLQAEALKEFGAWASSPVEDRGPPPAFAPRSPEVVLALVPAHLHSIRQTGHEGTFQPSRLGGSPPGLDLSFAEISEGLETLRALLCACGAGSNGGHLLLPRFQYFDSESSRWNTHIWPFLETIWDEREELLQRAWAADQAKHAATPGLGPNPASVLPWGIQHQAAPVYLE